MPKFCNPEPKPSRPPPHRNTKSINSTASTDPCWNWSHWHVGECTYGSDCKYEQIGMAGAQRPTASVYVMMMGTASRKARKPMVAPNPSARSTTKIILNPEFTAEPTSAHAMTTTMEEIPLIPAVQGLLQLSPMATTLTRSTQPDA